MRAHGQVREHEAARRPARGAERLPQVRGRAVARGLAAERQGPREQAVEDGVVVGVEHVPELVRLAERNFQADGKAHLLATKKHHPRGEAGDGSALSSVRFVAADGRLGYEPEAPYDAIHVGAAAPHVPDALVEQLARGGQPPVRGARALEPAAGSEKRGRASGV